jgi:E3 ubiquitin-protein ligase RNF216
VNRCQSRRYPIPPLTCLLFQTAIVPYVDIRRCAESVFACPECSHESCRACRKTNHFPLNCTQVAEQESDQNRRTVEETMTAALVRQCPRCAIMMTKDEGCNKLSCPFGIFVCNVCKTRIEGYGHFCRTVECRHENCGRCGLWSSTNHDDQRAIDDARRAGEVLTANLRRL